MALCQSSRTAILFEQHALAGGELAHDEAWHLHDLSDMATLTTGDVHEETCPTMADGGEMASTDCKVWKWAWKLDESANRRGPWALGDYHDSSFGWLGRRWSEATWWRGGGARAAMATRKQQVPTERSSRLVKKRCRWKLGRLLIFIVRGLGCMMVINLNYGN